MTTLTTYEAVNPIGTVLRTFSDPDLAKAWARKNAQQWPGVSVEKVTVTTTRRKLWTDHKWFRLSKVRAVERQERAA